MLYRSIASFISSKLLHRYRQKIFTFFHVSFTFYLRASFRPINFVTLILHQRIILFSLYSFHHALFPIFFTFYQVQINRSNSLHYINTIFLYIFLFFLFHLFLKFHHVKWFTFLFQPIYIHVTIILYQ